MKKLVITDKKIIIINILKLLFVFLIPLSFYISSDASGINLGMDSQSYAILGITGTVSRLRFRWIITRYPISVVLALISFLFSIRLYQRQDKSYPIFSAIATILAISIIPLYAIIQFFSMNYYDWFDVVFNLQVSIGFCSLLLLMFIILPSMNRWSRELASNKEPLEPEDRELGQAKKRFILTPKVSSYLIMLAAFIFPGVIVWESTIVPEYSSSSASCIAFLLQYSFLYNSPLGYQVSYSIQYAMLWRTYGASIASCFVGLIFAWTVIRYVYGKGRRVSAAIIGVLSLLPLVVSALTWQSYSQNTLIMPFPIVFVLGLVILRYADAVQPPTPYQSAIRVPLLFRLKSRLFGYGENIEKQPQDMSHNDEQSE